MKHVGRIMARLSVVDPERWGWLLPPAPPKDFSAGLGGGWVDCTTALASDHKMLWPRQFMIQYIVVKNA
jgi:hypothetical protein